MDPEKPVRIVHAPNHRHYKGTEYLLASVEQLKKEGLNLELVLVEKTPNDEALAIYRSADIVAEQFLIGWHGYMALESMALGKPVIAFIRKKDYLLAPDECPVQTADPDHLADVLKELVKDAEKRHWLGEQGRRYVEKYYSVEAFSERLGKVYQEFGIMNQAVEKEKPPR